MVSLFSSMSHLGEVLFDGIEPIFQGLLTSGVYVVIFSLSVLV
jgi:hypothetical protein